MCAIVVNHTQGWRGLKRRQRNLQDAKRVASIQLANPLWPRKESSGRTPEVGTVLEQAVAAASWAAMARFRCDQ
jgi:hypothetical protein